MTTTDNSDLPNDFKSNNEGANFWRIKKKVSTIPGKYKTKKPKVEWTDYEKVPPTKEQHNIWLNDGSYDGGVFIMPGPVLDANDNYSEKGAYVIGFDFDNQNAMLEFCNIWPPIFTRTCQNYTCGTTFGCAI